MKNTLTNSSKLTIATIFALVWVLLAPTASADYIAPAYVEQISAPVLIPGISIGGQYQNRQVAGTEFCVSGGFRLVLKNPYTIDSTDSQDGWTAGTYLEDVSDSDGGASTLNLLSLVNIHGAGYYGLFSNNSIGCGLAEEPIVQGSSYAFAYVNSLGYATYYGTPSFTAPTTTGQIAFQYIKIIAPEYGSTTGNNVTMQVQFKTPVTIDLRPTTTRTVVIRDAVTLQEEERFEETLEANAGENLTLTYNATLTDGSKTITAYYARENGTVYSETATGFFNVNVNSYQIATGLVNPEATPTETQNDCTTFDVGCQFQKALMFLFYPSQAVLDRFSSVWQNISSKKPFGYVSVTIDQLVNLDTNSAQAFDLGAIPFENEIFNPFKLALGSIMWAIFGIYFYQRRLKHLDL